MLNVYLVGENEIWFNLKTVNGEKISDMVFVPYQYFVWTAISVELQ